MGLEDPQGKHDLEQHRTRANENEAAKKNKIAQIQVETKQKVKDLLSKKK